MNASLGFEIMKFKRIAREKERKRERERRRGRDGERENERKRATKAWGEREKSKKMRMKAGSIGAVHIWRIANLKSASIRSLNLFITNKHTHNHKTYKHKVECDVWPQHYFAVCFCGIISGCVFVFLVRSNKVCMFRLAYWFFKSS